ncbi:diguanylate cyclase [Paenibacillus sp. NEAU-GSW1]|uniref:diguanylate cyclase domain-containing protein n=1 Tax=Paenibacillus sp. NEAU-GSW1 TaxID=2682486 RepID=UPI0012E0CD57|nr:diguanylate cyclase [Paenibacillus sp. NEAU-GSW1]MUT68289.1 diguanylate cyclase [Paenibacillus sp. NEAU-GSW1]
MKSIYTNGTPAYTLFNVPSNPSHRRLAFVIGAVLAVITLMSIPYAQVELPKSNTYLPTLLGAVVCFELITVFVLYSQFRVNRLPLTLILCGAYLYSALMTLAYLLTFPGFFPPGGIRMGNQTAELLYALWHIGFPLAVLLYTMMPHRLERVSLTKRQAMWCTGLVGLGVTGIVALIVYASIVHERRIPILMDHGKVTDAFTYGLALPILVLSAAALVSYYWRTRGSTVTSSWLCVALLATMLDVGIVLFGGSRFSLGWYISKFDTFIFSNVVLGGMIYEFTRMYVKMTDLYEEGREAQRTISEQKSIIERMLASSHEGIAMCDGQGNILFANGRFEELFGKPLAIGESLECYCEGMKLLGGGSLSESIRSYLGGGQAVVRDWVIVQNEASGETFYYEYYGNPIAGEDGDSFHGHLFVFGNQTETVRKVHYDELTGLANRRYIREWLERRTSQLEVGTSEPYAVLFLDLDGFKGVNDTLGHEMGDRLLQEVARVLRRAVGDQGMAGRWAGDEFVIVVERFGQPRDLERLAENIIASVRGIRAIDGSPIRISGSIGITAVPSSGVEAATLLQQADQAMYEAKANGKNRYCFYERSA